MAVALSASQSGSAVTVAYTRGAANKQIFCPKRICLATPSAQFVYISGKLFLLLEWSNMVEIWHSEVMPGCAWECRRCLGSAFAVIRYSLGFR